MMKRHDVLTSLLLSAGIVLSAPVVQAATPLNVAVNESRYVQEPELSHVAIGSPEIADVQLVFAGWQKIRLYNLAGLGGKWASGVHSDSYR